MPKRLALEAVADALAESDPVQAVAWALSLAEEGERTGVLERAIVRWVRADSTTALGWLEHLPHSADKTRLIAAAATELAYSAPAQAYRLVMTHLDEHSRLEALPRIAHIWARYDRAGALQQLNQMPAGPERSKFLFSLASVMAEESPSRAAALLNSAATGSLDTPTVRMVVTEWAAQDPVSAAAWVAQIPDTHQRQAVISDLVLEWAQSDHSQAGRWLETLPADIARDRGITAYVSTLAQQAPPLAASWVAKIQDAELRQQAIFHVAQAWMVRDRQAATTWLAQWGWMIPQAGP